MKKIIRIISVFLSFLLIATACAPAAEKSLDAASDSETDAEITVTGKETDTESESVSETENETLSETETDTTDEEAHMLNGKKILFIGNSYIYYGKTVIGCSNHSYNDADNNHGLFFFLCQTKGARVNCVNWTFPSHGLKNIMSGEECPQCGHNHLEELNGHLDYDYVVIGPGRGEESNTGFLDHVKRIQEIFTSANPNVEIICLSCCGLYGVSPAGTTSPNIVNNLKTIEEWGVKIVDWGGLVYDILEGRLTVPDTKYEYTNDTFVINQSESDGFHPNQLSGYITSLMIYCTITGEKAEGQACSVLFNNENHADDLTFDYYVNRYYREGTSTNYPEILSDEEEILKLQRMIDDYMENKSYRNYNYNF